MTQSRRSLAHIAYDPELTQGAANAVNVCLRAQPHEKVALIADRDCLEIAASLEQQLDVVGCRFRTWILEEYVARPMADMPGPILEDLATSQVSIYAVVAQQNELRTRMQMTDVVNANRIRHAHMVNIEKRIMLDGMRADFNRVDEISQRVWDLASAAEEIMAKTPAGTDITARLTPKHKWLKTSGIISDRKWGNLPGGEIFTAPLEVNGTFVIDGVVGDYLCAKYGKLESAPLTIRVEGNRLKEAHSDNKELENDFWRYTHTDENSDAVGEFAIGTNIQLRDVIGNILQDEKIPGVHIAFGNPYGAHTGAEWYSSTHIDVVGKRFDIWIDGLQIMSAGEFSLPA